VLNEEVGHAHFEFGEFREELEEPTGDDVAASGIGGEFECFLEPLFLLLWWWMKDGCGRGGGGTSWGVGV